MRQVVSFSAALGLALLVSVAAAAQPARAPAAAEKRVALVIGNGAYKEAPLKNPVNDARAMATALQGLGFEIIKRENASQKDMNRAIGEFTGRLVGGGTGLFYYAGHGMQVKGRNYLLPVDAEIGSEMSVRTEAVDVDQVL
ncbi:MAG: caspase family protein, partial [Proteobacteria bacterium]|nr:caspase family protein [Pseudomonadota bacterium]